MILIDDRTGSAELEPLISCDTLVCRLDYADFAWPGFGPDGPVMVGVERKALHDFIQSMTTGRLSGHQLVGLTQQYDWVYIIVEGIWGPDRKTGILKTNRGKWRTVHHGSRTFMARDLYNFINSMTILCGIVVVQTSNKWETGKWLEACHSWWQKDWDKHKSHLQFHKPVTYASLRKPDLVTRVASQFDGIGWDKAKALGRRFPLLEDLLFATKEDLMEVDGIGPKLAESIIRQRNGGSK